MISQKFNSQEKIKYRFYEQTDRGPKGGYGTDLNMRFKIVQFHFKSIIQSHFELHTTKISIKPGHPFIQTMSSPWQSPTRKKQSGGGSTSSSSISSTTSTSSPSQKPKANGSNNNGSTNNWSTTTNKQKKNNGNQG